MGSTSTGHDGVIVLTLDTDWAPECVLRAVLGELAARELRATVFYTDLSFLPEDGSVEAGVHPNFMADSTQGGDEETIISTLKRWFPQARGVRTHRLYWHNGLAALFACHGIAYDSSLALAFHPGLRPTKFGGLVRFPIWWGDNLHIMEGLPFDSVDLPGLRKPGLKVFNVHPIHVYLNTRDLGATREAMRTLPKPLPQCEPDDLAPFVQRGPGLGDFFRRLCDHASAAGQGRTTLGALADSTAGA